MYTLRKICQSQQLVNSELENSAYYRMLSLHFLLPLVIVIATSANGPMGHWQIKVDLSPATASLMLLVQRLTVVKNVNH